MEHDVKHLLRKDYLSSVRNEIGNKGYASDMIIDGSWVYCYFLSERRPLVYQLCLSTATFELNRRLSKIAAENVAKRDQNYFDFEKQASEILVEERTEAKRLYETLDFPIYERCVKIHDGGNYYEIIKGVINVNNISKHILKGFIKEFLENGELFWQTSTPIKFTKKQLNSIFS